MFRVTHPTVLEPCALEDTLLSSGIGTVVENTIKENDSSSISFTFDKVSLLKKGS